MESRSHSRTRELYRTWLHDTRYPTSMVRVATSSERLSTNAPPRPFFALCSAFNTRRSEARPSLDSQLAFQAGCPTASRPMIHACIIARYPSIRVSSLASALPNLVWRWKSHRSRPESSSPEAPSSLPGLVRWTSTCQQVSRASSEGGQCQCTRTA